MGAMRATRIAFALAAVLATPPLAAAVTEELRHEHYEVVDRAGRDLVEGLDRASPFRPRHGRTDWHIAWRFNYAQLPDGQCRMVNVATALKLTITLPMSKNPSIADSALFRKYLAALEKHEQGHVEIARQAARDIDRAILALAPAPSCASLEAAANKLGYERVEQARRADRQYDIDTEHGKTQGAYLGR